MANLILSNLISMICLLPITLSLLILLFPFVLWMVASLQGHINPFFPYVSDLGVVQPEESLFTFSLSFGAVLLLLFVLLRYLWTRWALLEATSDNRQASVVSSSRVEQAAGASMDSVPTIHSLLTGFLMTIGFVGVASFRNADPTGVQVTHNLFAALAFLSTLLDIYFEWQMASLLGSTRTARYRCLIFSLVSVFFLGYSSTGIASFVVNPRAFVEQDLRLHWSPEQSGYWLHITSTSLEWLLILMLSPYTLTYHSLFAVANNINNKVTSTV